MDDLQVLASAEVTASCAAQGADEGNALARAQERGAGVLRAVFHETDHRDRRGGKDPLPLRLVVERHVARHDRRPQSRASIGDSEASLFELPQDLRPLRIAEVEAVAHRERLAAHAAYVARRFRDGMRSAEPRLEVAVA